MKRLLTGFFGFLILLNVMGYYGVFLGMRYHSNQRLSQLLSDGDFQQEIQEAKVPFKSPFSSEAFTASGAEFKKDGQVYRLIKHRLYRDTFHVVYILDKRGTAIDQAIEEYVKTFTPDSQDEAGVKDLPSFIKEYVSRDLISQEFHPAFFAEIALGSTQKVFIDRFNASVIQPPES